MEPVIPVILAGGTGSRLWPLSRELYPKQFHALFDEHSLLQNTLLRAARTTSRDPIIVCNEEHRFLVAEQCRALNQPWASIILEPEGRNTAPAIALAALAACRSAERPLLLVLPSDHLIGDAEVFCEAVEVAAKAASEGDLVTFGITPTRPETGYGYIESNGAVENKATPVRSFVEKPDLDTARRYLASGDYLWNSGMFVLDAKVYLDEVAKFCPEMHAKVTAAYESGAKDLDFFRPGPEFLDSPSDSIDYAVMEKTDRAVVVRTNFDWSDIGSWSSLWESSSHDDEGNHLTGDVVAVATRNSYVLAKNRLVGTIGIENLVIVETADAVLVADKSRVQDVKVLVEKLKSSNREEHRTHREVFRPWGSFESVGTGERYQVKRIKVKPGASLSLQMHHHRAEHWVVVRGTAEVTRGEETFMLGENESTYIPLGTKHRLKNPGKLTLELIEVQVGAYLGEDDIIRFEDIYGR